MSSPYSAYRPIIGGGEHDRIARLCEKLEGRDAVMVNSTRDGGGVAEILHNMVPLLNELGVKVTWEVIEGRPDFFAATKILHNGLHGRPERLTEEMEQVYWDVSMTNARKLGGRLDKSIVFIHDPQPAGLLRCVKQRGQRWIYRCHVDVSSPYPPAWEFLGPIVGDYDASVFSHPSFAQRMADAPSFWWRPPSTPSRTRTSPFPRTSCAKPWSVSTSTPAAPLSPRCPGSTS